MIWNDVVKRQMIPVRKNQVRELLEQNYNAIGVFIIPVVFTCILHGLVPQIIGI